MHAGCIILVNVKVASTENCVPTSCTILCIHKASVLMFYIALLTMAMTSHGNATVNSTKYGAVQICDCLFIV